MDDDENRNDIVWFPALVADPALVLPVLPPEPPPFAWGNASGSEGSEAPKQSAACARKQRTTRSIATTGTPKPTRYHLRNMSLEETQKSKTCSLSSSPKLASDHVCAAERVCVRSHQHHLGRHVWSGRTGRMSHRNAGFQKMGSSQLRYPVTLRLFLADRGTRSWDAEFFDVTKAYCFCCHHPRGGRATLEWSGNLVV